MAAGRLTFKLFLRVHILRRDSSLLNLFLPFGCDRPVQGYRLLSTIGFHFAAADAEGIPGTLDDE